jgi:hypothetical protein
MVQEEVIQNDERVYRQVHLTSSRGASMMNAFGAWFVGISIVLALIMTLRMIGG